jgi:putative Holliday junction resolvase
MIAMGRILGLDYGEKRVGIAISDPSGTIASPLEVYARRDPTQDIGYFRKLVAENEIERIVVGLPLYPSGDESPKSDEARRFGHWLQDETGVPVEFCDERYTTVEAETHLREAELTSKKRQARRDMLAAQIILQAYLDAQHEGR